MSTHPGHEIAPLTAYERHRLSQLQRELETEDPDLARALRVGRPDARNSDRRGLGHMITAVAVALLVLPLFYIATLGAALFAIVALTGWLLRALSQAAGTLTIARGP